MDIFDKFDDFESFLELVSKPGLPINHTASIKWNGKDRTFYGTETYMDAVKLAISGWPDGLAKMDQLRKTARHIEPPESLRLDGVFAESGDEVCIGRFVSGDPECMVQFQPVIVPASGRVARIVFNCSASEAISTGKIFRKGAAAVALIDAVEKSGLRAEVWVNNSTNGRSQNRCELWVCIKKSGQPLEMDRIAFATAHPAMLRRLVWRWKEHIPNARSVFTEDSPYGFPSNSKHILPTDIYVEPMQYGFGNELNTDEDVTKFVNAMLDKYLEPVAA